MPKKTKNSKASSILKRAYGKGNKKTSTPKAPKKKSYKNA
jgi:hypothetical protein